MEYAFCSNTFQILRQRNNFSVHCFVPKLIIMSDPLPRSASSRVEWIRHRTNIRPSRCWKRLAATDAWLWILFWEGETVRTWVGWFKDDMRAKRYKLTSVYDFSKLIIRTFFQSNYQDCTLLQSHIHHRSKSSLCYRRLQGRAVVMRYPFIMKRFSCCIRNLRFVCSIHIIFSRSIRR